MRVAIGRAIAQALSEATRLEMRWGRDDCALWVANILREPLGVDLAHDFRGRYRSRAGAARALGAGGLPALGRKLARDFQWKSVRPGAAHIGDLGIVETKTGAALVIRFRGRFWVGRNERGFSAVRSKHVRIAWAI